MEDNGGTGSIWSWNESAGEFQIVTAFDSKKYGGQPYDEGDALVTGDVLGDEKEEIIIVEDNGGTGSIWSWDQNAGEFKLTAIFDSESFGTQPYDEGDALVVGDIWGDTKDEIMIVEDNGGTGEVWGWDVNATPQPGFRVIMPFNSKNFGTQPFDEGDALVVGDVIGDTKEEIIIVEDNGGTGEVWGWDVNAAFEPKIKVIASFNSNLFGGQPFDEGDALRVGKFSAIDKISGDITDGHSNLLKGVKVTMNEFGGVPIDTYTNDNGQYSFNTFRGSIGNITVMLEDKGLETVPYLRIIESGMKKPVYINTINFTVLGDMIFNIDFSNNNRIATSNVNLNLLGDYGPMYLHAYQALDLAINHLKLNLDFNLPEEVYGFAGGNTTFHCPSNNCLNSPGGAGICHIVIDAGGSGFGDWNRPDNREWHEFGHHIMLDSKIGGDNDMPDWHGTIPGLCMRGSPSYNQRHNLDSQLDCNHDGFNNHCTSDSWMEGWAEFISLVIADIQGEPNPNWYRWQGGDPWLIGVYGPGNDDLDNNDWVMRRDEEFAVAGILWDLYDGGPGDDDNVDLTLGQIWETVNTNQINNVRQLYIAFQTFFNNAGLNVKDLDNIFIIHGASGEPYDDIDLNFRYTLPEPLVDINNNGTWDSGESFNDINRNGSWDDGDPFNDLNNNKVWDNNVNIGYTTDKTRANRENKPLRHGSYLCLNVIDEQDELITKCKFTVKRDDGAQYDFTLSNLPEDVYFYMPPYETNAYITAHESGKEDTPPLIITSSYYWTSIIRTDSLCLLRHTFRLYPFRKFNLSVHGGSTIPLGYLSNNLKNSYSFILDVAYNINSELSIEGLIGYNNFQDKNSSINDSYLINASSNLKYNFSSSQFRPFINGGFGAYFAKEEAIKIGANLGIGLDYKLIPEWTVELGGNYHHVFTSGNDLKFIVSNIGLIYRF